MRRTAILVAFAFLAGCLADHPGAVEAPRASSAAPQADAPASQGPGPAASSDVPRPVEAYNQSFALGLAVPRPDAFQVPAGVAFLNVTVQEISAGVCFAVTGDPQDAPERPQVGLTSPTGHRSVLVVKDPIGCYPGAILGWPATVLDSTWQFIPAEPGDWNLQVTAVGLNVDVRVVVATT